MRHGDNGRDAEELVKRKYDLTESGVEWCDLTDPRTGARYEVKSAERALASGREGRFRLWEDQHRSLTAANSAGSAAWYVFVTDDGATYTRRRVTHVTQIVNDRGGWNESGHRRGSRQLKIPVTVLI
jgi:hypothetical protein